MTPSVEAVTFDMGDTITDLREGMDDYAARGLARAGRVYDLLAEQGMALPLRDAFCTEMDRLIEERYGEYQARQECLDIFGALRWFFAQAGVRATEELIETAGATWCATRLGPMRLRTGARETLAALAARGLRLGIISNTIQPGRFLAANLERAGLLHFFTAGIYSSDVGVSKPHPRIFRAALDALDVPAERVVHVGDRLGADVAGAHAAGMLAILIEVPQRIEDDPQIIPEARIKELPDLVAVLDSFR